MTHKQIKVWLCQCGAGPEEIGWTEIVFHARKSDGERFSTIREDPSGVLFRCL
jgi:hypothetical protein